MSYCIELRQLLSLSSFFASSNSFRVFPTLYCIFGGVLIGVSKYNGLPELDGIPKDYENVIKTFTKHWNYNVLYRLSNNKYIYIMEWYIPYIAIEQIQTIHFFSFLKVRRLFRRVSTC